MKVLLVENDSADAIIVTRALAKLQIEFAVFPVTSLGEAVSRLGDQEEEYDLILLDLGLDDCVGIDCVTRLIRGEPNCPIIVLTGLQDKKVALEALREGAQDYLVKDSLSPELLQRSIEHALERHQLLNKNRELLESVREGKRLLESKNQKLEKACESAQRFVDHVSHEFRTPLTVIMSYAGLLQEGLGGPVTEKQSEFLKIIDDRASDLNNMVDDMLDVSQLESGLLSATRVSCQVGEILDHVMPAISRKALLRDVEIEVHVEEDLPLVFCDDEKAGRVVLNLAVNAIKFCGTPGRVTLNAIRRGEDDVEIRVSDNGDGIPAEKRQQIFERFSQLRAKLADGDKGFGLGLNIAMELTELNLGRMGLESAEGEGSTFSFTLPVNDPIEVARRLLVRSERHDDLAETIAVFEASVGPALSQHELEDADRFLKYCLRQNDLVFPVAPGRWVLMVSVPTIEMDSFLDRVEKSRGELNRNRPRNQIPDVQLDYNGSWRMDEEHQSVLQLLESKFANEEACCVG